MCKTNVLKALFILFLSMILQSGKVYAATFNDVADVVSNFSINLKMQNFASEELNVKLYASLDRNGQQIHYDFISSKSIPRDVKEALIEAVFKNSFNSLKDAVDDPIKLDDINLLIQSRLKESLERFGIALLTSNLEFQTVERNEILKKAKDNNLLIFTFTTPLNETVDCNINPCVCWCTACPERDTCI